VHLSQCCEENAPRFITHGQTSRAGNADADITPVIYEALQEKGLLPTEHCTDTTYAQAKRFAQSRQEYGSDVIAPTRADHKWQGQTKRGFDAASFPVDWAAQKVTCPAGRQSLSWTPALDRRDKQLIKSKFSLRDSKACPMKTTCPTAPRPTLTIRMKEHHEALLAGRARHKEAAFWEQYRLRSGIEGTISQRVRAFGMRQSR
jgi:transposase